MHRPRGRSVSQIQDEEIPSIETQHEFINKVLKWSISDLDRFIAVLKARVAAEEAYVHSLTKITKLNAIPEPEPISCFGDADTTYFIATAHYEHSIKQLVTLRRNLIYTMNQEIDMLTEVKEAQEQRRKKVKTMLGDRNTNYITYRSRDIVKLQKTYSNKCIELQNAQHQLQQQHIQQQQQLQQQAQQGLSPSTSDPDLTVDGLHLSDEPRQRLSSDSARDTDSISSLDNTPMKKGMANFMAQMRTQLANATAAAAAASTPDVTKQNAKVAKIATDITVADIEYRDGIRLLERLRKKQIEAANFSLKQVEIVFFDKSNVTKSALRAMLTKEKSLLAEETKILDNASRSVEKIDGATDNYYFNMDYRQRGFIPPSPIFYDNFHHGKCKDLLFGMTLDEYHAERGMSVPMLVTKCIYAVEQMGGLQKEGIYRMSGRQSNVEALRYAFEQNEQAVELDKSKFDIITIAAVLKIFLRELKTPLFHLTVQTRMEYATLDKQRRLVALQTKLASLSKAHRDTLRVLVQHLAKVNANNGQNKMNIQNLSVVFTPAIFHDHNHAEIPGEWRVDSVFEDMMVYHEQLFAKAEAQSQNQAAAAATMTPATPAVASHPMPPSHAAGSSGMLLTQPLQMGQDVHSMTDYPQHYQQRSAPQQPPTPSQSQPYYPPQLQTSLPTQSQQVQLTPPPQTPTATDPPARQQRTSSRLLAGQGQLYTLPEQQQPSQPATPIATAPATPSTASARSREIPPLNQLGSLPSASSSSEHLPEADQQSQILAEYYTNTSPGSSPTDEAPKLSRTASISKGPIPPRGDSLRQKLAHQQMIAQQQQQQQATPPLPPPVSTTPRQPSPTGPQTPTIAMPASDAVRHMPSSAQIITNPALADRSNTLARSLNFDKK